MNIGLGIALFICAIAITWLKITSESNAKEVQERIKKFADEKMSLITAYYDRTRELTSQLGDLEKENKRLEAALKQAEIDSRSKDRRISAAISLLRGDFDVSDSCSVPDSVQRPGDSQDDSADRTQDQADSAAGRSVEDVGRLSEADEQDGGGAETPPTIYA